MRFIPLLALIACPTQDSADTGEKDSDTGDTDTGDTDTDTTETDSDTDTITDWDPASTLCGEVVIVDECGSTLPSSVLVWTVRGGEYPCSDDTGGGPGWRDLLVDEPAVVGDLFQADIEAGSYAVEGYEASCYGCLTVDLVDDACPVVTLELSEWISADKPNIYLYPEAEAEVTVRVAAPDRITAEDPAYGQEGWRVWARPDGSISTAEGERDFLFYERSIDSRRFQREEGFCVPGRQAVAAMEDHLAALGFLPAEIADFGEAWDADLPRAEQFTVYPQTQGLPALRVEPEPDAVLRAWYLVEPGCAPVSPPELAPVARAGFHVAEWGLVLGGGLPREEVIVEGWR